MIEITFQSDGRIRVFAMEHEVSVSATAPINQLAAVLPLATMTAIRDRMAEFLDTTSTAPKLRKVN